MIGTLRPHFVIVPHLTRLASTTTFRSIFTRQCINPSTAPIPQFLQRDFATRHSVHIMPVSLTLSPSDSLLKFIASSFPNLSLTSTVSDATQTSSIMLPTDEVVSGTNTITHYLSPQLFPGVEYTNIETAEIGQWLTISALNQDAPAKGFLETLNTHLKNRTTILGDKPSIADIAVFVRLRDHVKGWGPEEKTGGLEGGWRYIVRWVDFVQNAVDLFGVKVPEEEKVKIDPNDVKTVLKAEEPVKDKKAEGGVEDMKKGKKEKRGTVEEVKKEVDGVGANVQKAKGVAVAAAPGAPQEFGKKEKKKEKKEKAPKVPAPKKEETPLSPCLIDFRVGQILKCIPHPNADSLYMSTIVCGDAPDSAYINPYPDPASPDAPPTRTVLSGLRGKVPIEDMQMRKVVLVCNLKPANMRGIKSSAMVLAASPRQTAEEDPHAGLVELVEPPENAQVGERVFFEGYTEGKPQEQLNAKQKVMETVQPGFFTTESCEVAFDGDAVFTGKQGEFADAKLSKGRGRLVTASGGVCKVKTLKGALVR